MKRLRLCSNQILSDEAADELAGTLLDERHYDLLVQDDCRVDRPDGEPLLVYRKNAIPYEVCASAYQALRGAAHETDNRGLAGGAFDQGRGIREVRNPAVAVVKSRTRFHELRMEDGALSRTSRAKLVESGIVGFFDRSTRYPYCRLTAFNLEEPEKFAAALPFIRAADRVFAAELPERHAAQRAFVERTHPQFTIHGTVFTTVTVNRNWRTAAHKDQGDLPEGFGVMAVLQAGHYRGGFLVFPKFRVAVDMRSRGVLLGDVHQWHGNTEIVGTGAWERISTVLYYRRKMEECGSPAEERERAKRRRRGDPINGKATTP